MERKGIIKGVTFLLSLTAVTFFTTLVVELVDSYFVERYKSKALIYFLITILFLSLSIYLTTLNNKKRLTLSSSVSTK